MKFNNHSPRFCSFSIGLDMDVKLRGLRSGFWRCFGLSVGFLTGLVLLDPFRPTAEQAPRPPAIKLVQTLVVASKLLSLNKSLLLNRWHLNHRRVRSVSARLMPVLVPKALNSRNYL